MIRQRTRVAIGAEKKPARHYRMTKEPDVIQQV
jgi:hypothetical protein